MKNGYLRFYFSMSISESYLRKAEEWENIFNGRGFDKPKQFMLLNTKRETQKTLIALHLSLSHGSHLLED